MSCQPNFVFLFVFLSSYYCNHLYHISTCHRFPHPKNIEYQLKHVMNTDGTLLSCPGLSIPSSSSYMLNTGWPTVLEFLEFLELFWNFFGTGNVLEKSHFFRVFLELFLNSEFLTSNFLGYNISGLPPVWISHLWENITSSWLFVCSWKMWKCSWNVLELFWNVFKNSVVHPVIYTSSCSIYLT